MTEYNTIFDKIKYKMDDDIIATLKILIIGESGVGKSSLLLRFTDDLFDAQQAATIGKKIHFRISFKKHY